MPPGRGGRDDHADGLVSARGERRPPVLHLLAAAYIVALVALTLLALSRPGLLNTTGALLGYGAFSLRRAWKRGHQPG